MSFKLEDGYFFSWTFGVGKALILFIFSGENLSVRCGDCVWIHSVVVVYVCVWLWCLADST